MTIYQMRGALGAAREVAMESQVAMACSLLGAGRGPVPGVVYGGDV